MVLWNWVLYLQPFSRYCALSVLGSRFSGHVTSSVTQPFDSQKAISYWWSFGTIAPMVSEIFNVECSAMVDMTLIWPLNKGQGHSFWYSSISHIRQAVNSNFCSRTHRLATIHNVTDDDRRRQTQHCSKSAYGRIKIDRLKSNQKPKRSTTHSTHTVEYTLPAKMFLFCDNLWS